MKNIHTHLRLFLLFGVFVVLLSQCKKDEPESNRIEEYFEGKVNAQELEPQGYFGCTSLKATHYPDGFLEYEPGYFVFSVRNCELGQSLALGVYSGLEVGNFTSCLDPRNQAFCRFSDLSVITADSTEHLSAYVCDTINLQIRDMKPFESESSGFVEGRLDAVIRDTIMDSTIVVSDVKFQIRL